MEPTEWPRRTFCRYTCRLLSVALGVSTQACGTPSIIGPSDAAPTGTPTDPGSGPGTSPAPPLPPPPPPGSLQQLRPIGARLVDARTITIAIETLATPGAAATAEIQIGGIQRFILVARTGADTYSAVDGVCTHQGCIVSQWASPVYVCSCHGSRYTFAGDVVQGPAVAALQRFETELVNDGLLVRV